MKLIVYVISVVWIVTALYFGIAGWQGTKALEKTSTKTSGSTQGQSVEYEGINFDSEESLRQFLRDKRSSRWFPWIFSIPQDLTPLIAAVAFGVLGGAARLVKRLSLDGDKPSLIKTLSDPLFGGILGLAIFFLSLLAPAVLTSGKNPARAEAVVGISLFAGIFSEHAFGWIEQQVKRLFKSN